jgi:hypothetical protein
LVSVANMIRKGIAFTLIRLGFNILPLRWILF